MTTRVSHPTRRRAGTEELRRREPGRQHRRVHGPQTRRQPASNGRGAPSPHRQDHRGTVFRLIGVLLIVLVAAGGLVYRLVDLQLRNADDFVEIGRQQRFRIIQLAGERGDILDRNGATLATSLPATSFFVDPEFVEDPIEGAARLAPVLGRPVGEVRALLGGDGRFAWLARQVSDAKAAEIRALDIPGVFATEEPQRFHPAGNGLARSLVGSVDIDSHGTSGIELIADEHLEGQNGQLSVEIGVNGNRIPGGPELLTPAVPGADVMLTIDRSLQFEVERVLTDQVDEMGARGGVVIVTEPSTGEVLAMASVARDDDWNIVSSSLNMATSWSFEPGSVMKAVTFSGVLDAGLADTTSRMTVPDTYRLHDAVFTDSHPHATTDWTVNDIVTVSSNVGTIQWAELLGGEWLDYYLKAFGFGRPTNFGFPGETAGLMIEPDRWGGIGTATMALGQGVLVTPVQMISAYNAIANDGTYTPLQLVREYTHEDGTREVPPSGEQYQVISPSAAAQVRAMLESAVAVGTGTNAQVEGYRVAGKTGTARKAIDGGAGYQDGAGNYRYVASFVGFLPADRPQLSILVTIDQPTATIYGGHAAAPAFADIASFAVRHLRIAPPLTPAGEHQEVHVPNRLEERITGERAEPEAEQPEGPAGPDAEQPEGPAEPDASTSSDDRVAEVAAPEPAAAVDPAETTGVPAFDGSDGANAGQEQAG